MPATASGTSYTVYSATVNGEACYWAVANSHVADAGIPTILYAHGAGGAANQFATLAAWQGLRDWLIDNGWAWIEGDCGGAQSWGNAAARAALPAYLTHVEGILDIGPVVLLGRSMGGLVTAYLYANDTEGRYAAWINNSGVSTMLAGTSTGAHDVAANSAYYFSPTTFAAWGVADYAALVASVTAADMVPEDWPATRWTGKNILCVYGDADTTVPWSPRGASALRATWAGEPAIDSVRLRVGGDHSGTNGSYLEVEAMTAFLAEALGEIPPEPSAPVAYSIDALSTRIGGRTFDLDFTTLL